MAHYLLTIHRPQGYDGQVSEDAAMRENINELNRQMIAAGVRVFVGGLQGPDKAFAVRPQADGTLETRPGPYLPGEEHLGGLWVLELASLDEGLEWGRKAAIACKAGVELRPFHSKAS